MAGADHAVQAPAAGLAGQLQGKVRRIGADAGHLAGAEAGQGRDAEKLGSLAAVAVGGNTGLAAHALAALAVQGQQFRTGGGSGLDGLGHGVGDVVKFHVQEDMEAKVVQVADDVPGRPG